MRTMSEQSDGGARLKSRAEQAATADAETRLVAVLASLRVSQTPEAGFEERFLYDFHERIAREAVCCPARHRLFEHLLQMLENFGRRRLAYGASTLGVGVLAVGGYMAIPEQETSVTSSAVMSRFDSGIAAMSPALSRDLEGCINIRVETQADPLDKESVLVVREPRLPVMYNAYTSSMPRPVQSWDSWGGAPAVESAAVLPFSF